MTFWKYLPIAALILSVILLAWCASQDEYFKLGYIRKGSCADLKATRLYAPLGSQWKSQPSRCSKKNARGKCIEYECETVNHPNDE